MFWLCLPAFLLPIVLVGLIKVYHWERRRRLLFVLGFVVMLIWPPVWFFWPELPFFQVEPSIDLFIWSYAACVYPILGFWITLAVCDRLVLGTD